MVIIAIDYFVYTTFRNLISIGPNIQIAKIQIVNGRRFSFPLRETISEWVTLLHTQIGIPHACLTLGHKRGSCFRIMLWSSLNHHHTFSARPVLENNKLFMSISLPHFPPNQIIQFVLNVCCPKIWHRRIVDKVAFHIISNVFRCLQKCPIYSIGVILFATVYSFIFSVRI